MYASQQDLIDRYGQQRLVDLTDRSEPFAGTIDEDVIEQALSDAAGEIDGYLRSGGYSLPLADPPSWLRSLCMVLAYRYLHIEGAPEGVQSETDQARRSLRDIANGKLKLPDAKGGGGDGGDGRVQVGGPERTFGRDTLKGF